MNTTTNVDHKATREAMTEQVAAFLANPAGWPAAMAARALRLRAGHPAYSPNNHALIIGQLWARFESEGLSQEDAFTAAINAAAEEIAPRYIWAQRGFTPTGDALAIYSRPIPMWLDPVTGKKVEKDTPGAVKRNVFRIEATYRAADVINDEGVTGTAAFTAPELPEGEARVIFARLEQWITGQGWTVERSGSEMAAGGYTAHAARRIVVHGGLTEWAAVETLAHEIGHALMHGADDTRPYAGEHRGDMEAEAEAVAYGLLTAWGQSERARGAARYAVEWTGSPERVAAAYEKACHVIDALAAVASGTENVTLAEAVKERKLQAKADNKALAAALREAGLEPKGEAWKRAKAGEPIDTIAADLAA